MLQIRDYDLDNYSTDENMVVVAIELTNCYDLERRKQAAACAADDRLCSPAAIADASMTSPVLDTSE